MGVAGKAGDSPCCQEVTGIINGKAGSTGCGGGKDRAKASLIKSNECITRGVFTHGQAGGSKDRVGTDTQTQVGLIPVEVAVVLSELV